MNHSRTALASPTAAAAWKQRYEALRQLATGEQQILETDPLGLVLLLRQGLAGWMRSWPELEPPPLPPMPTVLAPIAPTSAWQRQLTGVLAAMSLAHLPRQTTL